MHLKIEKKDSKERLTVSVSGAGAAKVLASWLGTANFRVSAEIVFGEDEPEAAPEAPAAPALKTRPEPDGVHVKIVRAHLAKHPASTAKDVAVGVDLPIDKVRDCLDWLVSAGQATQEGAGRGRGRTYSVAAGE